MPEQLLVSRHAGQHVLVADDNPICQGVLVELLQAVGIRVDVADNGLQALDMAASNRYALVLMDIQMPVLAGLSAARTLRERSSLAPPIVAMTLDATREQREQCLAAGMSDLLPKPVQPTELYTCLLHWLPPAAAPEGEPAATAGDPEPAAAAPPGGLHARLARVDGFDVDRVMGNLGGSPALLERTIAKFVKTYRSGVPALAAQSQAGDVRPWREACHGLRGATAMVGATALQGDIARFEAALNASRDAAELQAQARHLEVCVVRLAEQLEQALRGEP